MLVESFFCYSAGMKNESAAEHAAEKRKGQLVRKLSEESFVWSVRTGNYKGAEVTPAHAFELLTVVAAEQGGIAGLGNLEDVLRELVLACNEDAEFTHLSERYGIKGKPTHEEALTALEQLAFHLEKLPGDFEELYLDTLEQWYTDDIYACEQNSVCINSILEAATARASAAGIAGDQISTFRENIEGWAYNVEAA